jgi:Putative DNA-binding domain
VLHDVALSMIDKTKIDELVSNRASEGTLLEFKLQLPGNSDAEKREFLADVSAFANTVGGDICFGVAETEGSATGIAGVATADADSAILRIESILRDGIQPRIPSIAFRVVPVEEDLGVLVMRVPRSLVAPHMITFGNLSRFFARNSRGKYQLDVHELRDAFARSRDVSMAVREWRAWRVAQIGAAQTPVTLRQGASVVVQCVPLSTSVSNTQIDLSAVAPGLLPPKPLYSHAQEFRYNLDGIVVGHGVSIDQSHSTESYLQVFRSGALETVSTGLLDVSAGVRAIRTPFVEGQIFETVSEYLQLFARLSVRPPISVLISFLGVKGFAVHPETARRQWSRLGSKIEVDQVLLPDVLLQELSDDPMVALKPALDVLWQAAGWQSDMNYRDGKTWNP